MGGARPDPVRGPGFLANLVGADSAAAKPMAFWYDFDVSCTGSAENWLRLRAVGAARRTRQTGTRVAGAGNPRRSRTCRRAADMSAGDAGSRAVEPGSRRRPACGRTRRWSSGVPGWPASLDPPRGPTAQAIRQACREMTLEGRQSQYRHERSKHETGRSQRPPLRRALGPRCETQAGQQIHSGFACDVCSRGDLKRPAA